MVTSRYTSIDEIEYDAYDDEPPYQKIKSSRQQSYAAAGPKYRAAGNCQSLRRQKRRADIPQGIRARGSKRGTFRCDRLGKIRFTATSDAMTPSQSVSSPA